ncbi:MAG TPA: DUF805 domain-containing protein [Rhodoglobus sp.]|nr:DUF805 domain-containing protein [Rhodoglobus sp.]
MTFFESIKTVFRKYATFEGRATRPEFWWFALFSFLVSAALSALLPGQYMMGGYQPINNDVVMLGDAFRSGPVINLAGFWSIAVLLPSLAVTVRRLRDAGHRWTEIFWILLPIAGAIVLIVRLCDPSKSDAVVAPAAPAAPPVPPAKPAK